MSPSISGGRVPPRLALALRRLQQRRCASSAAAPPCAAPQPRRAVRNVYAPPPASATASAWRAPPPDAAHRSLAACLVGAPNAGKSTLINALLGPGRAVAAVSRKYNTTRRRTLGVVTDEALSAQLCLVDTPGFVREAAGGARFHRALVMAAVEAVPESDAVLLVLDCARRFDDEARVALAEMVALCGRHGARPVLVANKCDLLRGVPLDARQRGLSAALLLELEQRPELARIRIGGWAPARRPRPRAEGGGDSGGSSAGGDEDGHVSCPGGGDLPGTAAGVGASYGARSGRGGGPRMHRDLLGLKLHVAAQWLEAECVRAGIDADGASGPSDGAYSSDSAAASSPRSLRPAPHPRVFAVAAAHGHGVPELRATLLAMARPRAWAYAADTVTDEPLVRRVAEAIREQLLGRLHDEVPYRLQQETRSWRVIEAPGEPHRRVTEIHQDIRVPSQRAASMLLANGGAAIRAVAEAARVPVAALVGTRVRLVLHVTVKSDESMRRAAAAGDD